MGKQALALLGVHRETAWRNQLARYVASQLTVEAFCRREAVPVGTFYGWRARLRARGVDFDTAPAREGDDGPPHCTPSDIDIRLDLGGGVMLHIARH